MIVVMVTGRSLSAFAALIMIGYIEARALKDDPCGIEDAADMVAALGADS